jgi:hypothetical protein
VKNTTIYKLHGLLIRETFGGEFSDQDAFLIFVLFHSYRIELSSAVLSDRPGVTDVAALTQRDVSSALASAWRGTSDERADPYFWYFRWNKEWGSYGHAENLSAEEQTRLDQLKGRLEEHPFVSQLVSED